VTPATDAVERWFLSRGIPHFIDRYSATRDVFTRSVPVLTVVFLVEIIGAINLEWPAWANGLALVGGFAILLGGWAMSNRVRGLPAWRRPEQVGPSELAVFVIVPALLPVLFGGQLVAGLLTAMANLALLVVVYLGTSYGVVPMTRWAAVRLWRQVGSVLGLLVRALPLLLLFVTFLFVNAEVWAVADAMDAAYFWSIAGLFAAIGVVFLVSRLPREVGQLTSFTGEEELRRYAAGTPADVLEVRPGSVAAAAPPLTRRQWGNVGLVLLFTQGLQVLLVSVMMGAFFVVFGLLAITPEIVESWTAAPIGDPLVRFGLWGRDVLVTGELLRVSGFLAAFSGLYFTVYVVTDATYRQEFFEEVVAEVRQALAVRTLYLAALHEPRLP
jgi:hypothetical protein